VNEPKRFFVPLPWEFFDAWHVGRRVKRRHVLTAFYVAARCFEAKNTGGGVAPIELATVARLCDYKPESIRRALHDLREWGWIGFEAGDGGDPAWRVWPTGLSLDNPPPRPLQHLSNSEPPPSWRGLSKSSHDEEAANPHDERESVSNPSQSGTSEEPRIRDETIREREKSLSGEGETDWVSRDRGAPRVTRRDDGSLDWSGESLPREEGVLADCRALVDAGLAEWRDGDATQLRDDNELHEERFGE